jgi:hypothetical protein
MRKSRFVPAGALVATLAAALTDMPARADSLANEHAAARLAAAFPDHIAAVSGDALVWRDGSLLPLRVGRAPVTHDEILAATGIADMFAWPYPAGAPLSAPTALADPGRARHKAFFDKMYGACERGAVERHLVEVAWLPGKSNQRLRVTRINGVAGRLEAVSRELDRLPSRFDRYLLPAAGGYHCRPIAGTDRPSPHGYGIAIDIAVAGAHYWRWDRARAGSSSAWRNAIPAEIVEAFERQGFIWGGRWHHYDTMHFEYRPELIAPARREERP